MKVRTRSVALGSCAAALVLAGAGLAWGCTAMASVSVNPGEGAPGAQVVVSLRQFWPDPERPLHVRWNSPTGTILATTRGPADTVTITIPPDAPPDLYYVMGVQYEGTEIVGQNSASFEVVAPMGSAGSSGGSGGGGGGQPATVENPAEAGGAASPDSESGPAPADPSASPGQPAGSTPDDLPRVTGGSVSSSVASRRAATAAASASSKAHGQAPAARAAGSPGATLADQAPAAGVSPSPLSAAADLWSGFADGRSRSPVGPSLSEPLAAGRPSRGGGLALGLVVVAAGLVATVSARSPALRRRRVPTTP